MGKATISQFSDKETQIEILDPVQGQDVFLLQSTSSPTNHYIMELLLMADAARRAAAKRITAVIPYFGYARQDKRLQSAQVPISAKVIADLLTNVGINRVLTVDLHNESAQGFFSAPVENLSASAVMLQDIRTKDFVNPIVVSPDIGGVVRARAFAKHLNQADLAIIDKRRVEPNKTIDMVLIGEVKDRDCIIVDDVVDTAGTLILAAKTLKENGAKKVVAYVTHPVLSNEALQAIKDSALDEVVVTDTISQNEAELKNAHIRVLSISSLIAEAIRKVNEEKSQSLLSKLF